MNFSSSIQYLNDNQIKPSYPRVRIYDYLRHKKNHPTVDNIYLELVKEIPTLSKTTVYNTLNLFKEKGITRVLSIDGTETRYDDNICEHGHFKCIECGNIYDFALNINSNEDDLDGYEIYQRDFYYLGICSKCKE